MLKASNQFRMQCFSVCLYWFTSRTKFNGICGQFEPRLTWQCIT